MPPKRKARPSSTKEVTKEVTKEITKKPTLENVNGSVVPLDSDPSITQLDILNATSSSDVLQLVEKLTLTAQDQIFTEYRIKADKELEQQARRIEELEKELENKEQLLNEASAAVTAATTVSNSSMILQEPNPTLFISPIKKKGRSRDVVSHSELGKELETIGITFDMLELLTGLRVTNYEEDNQHFHFDVAQSSTCELEKSLSLVYRLTIQKKLDQSAEINYSPLFKKDNEYLGVLHSVLPEYFFDNLTFPYNTLSQFYTKVNRALNKGVKLKE